MQNDTCDEASDVVNSFLLGATHGDSNVLGTLHLPRESLYILALAAWLANIS